MFITAAPVGAVPKYLSPFEPKFIPDFLIKHFITQKKQEKVKKDLLDMGWKKEESKGLGIQNNEQYFLLTKDFNNLTSKEQKVALNFLYRNGWIKHKNGWKLPCKNLLIKKIKKETLELIDHGHQKRKVVINLTTQGWESDDNGDLNWNYAKCNTYLPINTKSAFADQLINQGWEYLPSGFLRDYKTITPNLPIYPDEIIKEANNCANEGAAIVHLHTRDLSNPKPYYLPGMNVKFFNIKNEQKNKIDSDQYDKIVPEILKQNPNIILNLSTSARGNCDNLDRSSHIKKYNKNPYLGTLSLGPVIFKDAGGYDNSEIFIKKQLEHFKKHNVKPEIEIFNRTILNNAVYKYQDKIEEPALFMLVVGSDQLTKDKKDDSLIPTLDREIIFNMLSKLKDKKRAIDLTIKHLKPIVQMIRKNFSKAKISSLMIGPMQMILAQVAIQLGLDGVRIGLEDGLHVFDKNISGYIRKAKGTWEQVRFIKQEIESYGIKIMSSNELRLDLGI